MKKTSSIFNKIVLGSVLLLCSFIKPPVPHLFIIGDSTVKNGKTVNGQKLVGWGELIPNYFGTSKISVMNEAIPGRSSRTFITEGHWSKLLQQLQKGDYLLLQFGHNDVGNIADSLKPRGNLKGIGEDSTLVFNQVFQQKEYVHSYGWYLRKIVREAKSKGVLPIIISPIPRHIFNGNKVVRADKDYALWASQIASEENVPFIDLNRHVADVYDSLGFDSTNHFFPQDHTHTNLNGATLNARQIIKSIQSQKETQSLRSYLIQ